jgi:hypothetical protein
MATYEVGKRMKYARAIDVPWENVGPGDNVLIHALPNGEAYRDKIQLFHQGTVGNPIKVLGVPDPTTGKLPRFDADGAEEWKGSKYWHPDPAKGGVITFSPLGAAGLRPKHIILDGIETHGCVREKKFTNANGEKTGWGWACAGVAFQKSENCQMSNCFSHDNENGVFGKSYGYTALDLLNIVLDGNVFQGNGIVGSVHYHNTYLEGVGTTYRRNKYGKLKTGSAGATLKDRSAGAVIAFNHISGSGLLLDLVEPEDGIGTFVQTPQWGSTWVYGNAIINPQWNWANSMIHFGFDGDWQNRQLDLYFWFNTLVSINDRDAGGRWYTVIFKHEGRTIYPYNNVFQSYSPDPKHWSGDFIWSYSSGGEFDIGVNYVPLWLQKGNSVWKGEGNFVAANDPGFVNQFTGNYNIAEDSICKGKASRLPRNLQRPRLQFDFDKGAWAHRQAIRSLGVIE